MYYTSNTTIKIYDGDSFYVNEPRFLTNLQQRLARKLAGRELGITPSERTALLVAESLFVLNQWARGRQDSNWKDSVYRLKSQFLHSCYALGYLKSVELCRQDIKCSRCENGVFRRYYWDSGDISYEDICWRCHGTGVYKKVLLYVFRVKIGDREFVWHQPEDRVGFAPPLDSAYLDSNGTVAVDLDALPRFKEKKTERPVLSNWQIQRHLLRLAVYVTRFQMFCDLELLDWKDAFTSDVKATLNQSYRWYYNKLGWRIRSLLERFGLVEQQLPF